MVYLFILVCNRQIIPKRNIILFLFWLIQISDQMVNFRFLINSGVLSALMRHEVISLPPQRLIPSCHKKRQPSFFQICGHIQKCPCFGTCPYHYIKQFNKSVQPTKLNNPNLSCHNNLYVPIEKFKKLYFTMWWNQFRNLTVTLTMCNYSYFMLFKWF